MKLIENNYVTQKVADAHPEALQYFVDTILPVISKTSTYPEGKNTFRALNECPEPKVVILGQDPYHDGSATGLAFDNLRGKKISPSLKNILKELEEDMGDQPATEAIGGYSLEDFPDSHLGHLPQQGVLLLNTALTVEPGKPGSHTKLWKPFTEQIIKDLQKKDNIVWILWGNHAKAFKLLISNPTHHILEGVHPMPLAANRGGFFGGKYFSKVNGFLKSVNLSPIQW